VLCVFDRSRIQRQKVIFWTYQQTQLVPQRIWVIQKLGGCRWATPATLPSPQKQQTVTQIVVIWTVKCHYCCWRVRAPQGVVVKIRISWHLIA